MGSYFTKDEHIDIYLETTQQIFIAGSYVRGTVYINVKKTRNYKSLILNLKGSQQVFCNGSVNPKITYLQQSAARFLKTSNENTQNKKDTYFSFFTLAVFPNEVVTEGYFSYPFKFLLPSELPGSLILQWRNYIRYALVAELVSSDSINQNQTYTSFLNILQPSRRLLDIIQKQQSTNAICCGCCKNYGKVNISMTCNKSFVKAGDMVHVTVFIDNSQGKQQIKNCKIKFCLKTCRISKNKTQTDLLPNYILKGAKEKRQIDMFKISEVIQPGQIKNFSFTSKIPQMDFSTAIGSILSIYHILHLTSSMGIFSNSPECKLPLIYHSSNQKLQQKEQMKFNPGRDPIVANEVVFNNLPTYNYNPMSGIPFLNRAARPNDSTHIINYLNRAQNVSNSRLNRMENQGQNYPNPMSEEHPHSS